MSESVPFVHSTKMAQVTTMSVPPSTLMHACLAYRSTEFQVFDRIILLHSKNALLISPPSLSNIAPKTNLSSLPVEVLLTIRAHLLPILTSHLIALSMSALALYESSLVSLLCPDCQAYSVYVYGSKVWNWPYFPGPCSCLRVQSNICKVLSLKTILPIANLRNRIIALFQTRHKIPLAIPSQTVFDIQVFSSPHHWLHVHLSKRASRIYSTGSRRSPKHSGKEMGIWDLVADVLREFECEVAPGDISSLLCHAGRSWPSVQEVSLVPKSSLGSVGDDSSSSGGGGGNQEWKDTVVIRRVERELGLCYRFDEIGRKNTDGRRCYQDRSRGAFGNLFPFFNKGLL